MKNKLAELYIRITLEENSKPLNVFLFCRKAEITESEFYNNFSNLESVETWILINWFEEIVSQTRSSELYTGYSSREKILSFYFNWFEYNLQNRSFITFLFNTEKTINIPGLPELPNAIQTTFTKSLKQAFIEYAGEIIRDGIQSKEIEDRKFLNEAYTNGLWVNFMFLNNFWLKDQSERFEKTDEAIEKSVNLGFDLMGKSPLESMLDFGKFMYQNR